MRPYYEHGGVTIYHADCFDVLHTLSGIGAVVTDPPYSSGGAFRGDRAQQTTTKYVQSKTVAYRPEFAGDNRDQRSFLAWSTLWLNAARNASVPGAVLASFIDWRQLPVLTDAVQAGGWTWRNLATWWKPGIRMQKGRFSSSAEYVVYATHGPVVDGVGSPQNVFRCKLDSDRDHIAQKPEEVMRWVMQVIPRGFTVLDPFMGTGATLRAAKDRGPCEAIGIEVDERYCEIAARRLSQEVHPSLALHRRPCVPARRGLAGVGAAAGEADADRPAGHLPEVRGGAGVDGTRLRRRSARGGVRRLPLDARRGAGNAGRSARGGVAAHEAGLSRPRARRYIPAFPATSLNRPCSGEETA